MEAIKVMVVDEESSARNRLRRLLCERSDFQLVGECGCHREMAASLDEERPDLVFLRVDRPEANKMCVLEDTPALILVSQSAECARDIIDVRAVDYLFEPFSDERFEWALSKARIHILHNRFDALSRRMLERMHALQNTPAASSGYLERLAIPLKESIRVYRVKEIDYFEGAGVYVKVHVGEETHLLREKLATLEERLDPAHFLRIHRSTIVNLDRVRELKPYYHGQYIVHLATGDELKLSRSRRDKFEEVLGRL